MRLTSYTDYSIRVLITLGALPEKEKISIQEIADAFKISKNHLKKVIHKLGQLGLVHTTRGRSGGIRLAKLPKDINIGWVVRHTEDDFHIVECFDAGRDACIISPVCRAKSMFAEALHHYLQTLDHYSLADVITNKEQLANQIERKGPDPGL
ncbi:BadM/Rrf2 family transcriptional regulator [Scopulibacillus darangshiensis]|uniref:HTH-type transcriptional regulator NsrR n=1 Tax=Scopulibacillus darangshiensis TaxID=442528 RepID=A0A4R2PCX8_9BACL|nr:Rrf2 family transcriptional regulator [Scopulibacillus darangshiensis]TCP32308.1 BadM/Rrf2 family transcriptional regulator [Scopulibacillus darangshiensis]